MCITLKSARLCETNIAYLVNFDTKRHSLIYENVFENQSNAPNAMVLPFLGQDLVFYDTRPYAGVLKHILKALKIPNRSTGTPSNIPEKRIQIIKVGSYHIVVAQGGVNAASIQNALQSLPEEKRPTFNDKLLDWYLQFYGAKATLAICCFDGSAKAEPIYCEFTPHNFDLTLYPGADSHDGDVPKIGQLTDRDHNLIFGVMGGPGDPDTKKVDFTGIPVPEILREASWQFLEETTPSGINCDWVMRYNPETNFWRLEDQIQPLA